MSEKVDAYIEVYRKWQHGPSSSKTYEILIDLRESMTEEEQVELASRLIPSRY